MTFIWAGKNKFIIDHIGIEKSFEGKGFEKLLVMKSVEFSREQDIKILPLCPFAKAEFDKNEEIGDVRL
jgi:hypothetical protein